MKRGGRVLEHAHFCHLIMLSTFTFPTEAAWAAATLIMVPLLLTGSIPFSDPHSPILHLKACWDCLLRFSVDPIVLGLLIVALQYHSFDPHRPGKLQLCEGNLRMKPVRMSGIITLTLVILVPVVSQLQMIDPSMLWNPFLWYNFQVYTPEQASAALQGLCLDRVEHFADSMPEFSSSTDDQPLCLSQESWETLSSGALSSDNEEDVQTVLQGVHFAKHRSGGLIINVLARNAMDQMQDLRATVESLVPFFLNKVSLVVFENDSNDGTRDAFKRWANEVRYQYQIDLVGCGDANPDCKLGAQHRYETAAEATGSAFFQGSAVERMGEYRQRAVDHILAKDDYRQYSHLLVLDHDLGVSFSPLGILHTLGKLPDNPVAVTGLIPYPTSLGSLLFPYDFSAFQASPDDAFTYNRLQYLHSKFCGLRPACDRWSNMCYAVSPFHLMQVLLPHYHHRRSYGGSASAEEGEPYQVNSAFNGAALYPMQVIRDAKGGATYDTGACGQQNEHVGFNLSLLKETHTRMYINPKWML